MLPASRQPGSAKQRSAEERPQRRSAAAEARRDTEVAARRSAMPAETAAPAAADAREQGEAQATAEPAAEPAARRSAEAAAAAMAEAVALIARGASLPAASREACPGCRRPPAPADGDVESGKAEECAICLGPMATLHHHTLHLKCGHTFHRDCIVEYVEHKHKEKGGREPARCPLCRAVAAPDACCGGAWPELKVEEGVPGRRADGTSRVAVWKVLFCLVALSVILVAVALNQRPGGRGWATGDTTQQTGETWGPGQHNVGGSTHSADVPHIGMQMSPTG